MSSANSSTLLVILSSKSLVYIKNNKGPNTDPCGTPLKNDFQFETYPSTTILLSVIHCFVQSIMPSPIPCDFNLSSEEIHHLVFNKLSNNLQITEVKLTGL